MMSLVSFTTPLGSAGTASSGPLQIARALNITGTVFSDQSGTAFVDQGGDGVHWDFTTSIAVTGGTGVSINVTVVDQWFQVRYTNGGTAQTSFRLFADARDPYGAFLQPAQAPSAGGAYGVLVYEQSSGTYSFVGRFDGTDSYNANANAALSVGRNGKYASFVVANCVVTDETIMRSTEQAPDAF